MSSDLSLEKHVSVDSAACFFSISDKFVVSGSHWMRSQQQLLALTTVTVSYTHLTLPTIYSV